MECVSAVIPVDELMTDALTEQESDFAPAAPGQAADQYRAAQLSAFSPAGQRMSSD